ncbi:hypothetical protein GA0061080_10148 [Gilliamella intestini]|uniref:DUF4234 domain-containing protein n=1 Tax=Gilliamella intestini TaxID=1798183 RepID=A0A1C4AU89_9GAMM|nr:hypothetical protein GA0061080_10148 [Gilliamella intestini]
MNRLNFLKQENNLTTFRFVLFSIITLGIYSVVWFYKRNKLIQNALGVKIVSDIYVIILIILNVVLFCADVISILYENNLFEITSNILFFVSVVMFSIWANCARSVLTYYCWGEYNIKPKTKSVYAVILGVFYINYLINALGKINKPDISK